MHCPHCGNPVPDNAKFCGNCGAPAGVPGGTAGMRKDPPVVLYAIIGIFLAAACTIGWYVWQSRLEDSPLKGARLKKQTVWTDGGRSYTVTGLAYEQGYDQMEKYPYVIGLAADDGRVAGLDCAAAVNGMQVNARVDGEGIRLARQHGSLFGGLGVITEIDLVLRDQMSGRCSDVIHLKTGKKKPDGGPHPDMGKATLYDGDGLLARYKTIYPLYTDAGPGLEFYLENRTGTTVSVGVRDVAIKGTAVTGRMEDEFFPPGTAGDAMMVLDMAEMEAKGVLPLKDVTLTLVLADFATGRTLVEAPVSIQWP